MFNIENRLVEQKLRGDLHTVKYFLLTVYLVCTLSHNYVSMLLRLVLSCLSCLDL